MIRLLRDYFDGCAERDARNLIEADKLVIDRWRRQVRKNITARKQTWANVAYLRINRARSYG